MTATFGAEFSRAVCSGAEALAVPPEWILAVIALESGFDPRAGNASGARGLWQKMPDRNGVPYDVTRSPASQIGDAVHFWRTMIQTFRVGAITSRESLYCLNVEPMRLRNGDYDGDTVLYAAPCAAYRANAAVFGLDAKATTGSLRIKDLAAGLTSGVRRCHVKYDTELAAAHAANVTPVSPARPAVPPGRPSLGRPS